MKPTQSISPTKGTIHKRGSIVPPKTSPKQPGFRIKTGVSSYDSKSIKPTGNNAKPC